MERVIPASELIINPDGSVFHLHIKPEMLVDNIILVGDPGRVEIVATIFKKKITIKKKKKNMNKFKK